MHPLHCVLLVLPFLATAIRFPVAEPPSASRGIAIPIAKRSTSLPLADPSWYEGLNQNTIA